MLRRLGLLPAILISVWLFSGCVSITSAPTSEPTAAPVVRVTRPTTSVAQPRPSQLLATILLGLETELRGGASKEESEEVKFCKPGGVMYVTGKRGEKCREIYDVDWQKVGSFCKQALTYGSLANPEVSLFLPLCTELQGNTSRSALSDDDWIRLVAQVEEILSR